jgi:hypothetical protein
MLFALILFLISVIAGASTAQAEAVPNPLLTTRALNCEFGEPGTDAAQSALAIRDINPTALTAKLRERSSLEHAAELIITESGLTFIEHAATGSLIFTTVFAGPPEETEFYAVQSRHLTMMTGIPQLAQRVGICALAN